MPFDGTKLNPTAAHLLAAKQYMQEHGWCKRRERTKDGRVCMIGAIRYTKDDAYNAYKAIDILRVAIGNNQGIPKFNDAPGRTIEEVYDAFDRAIALAME